MTSSSHGTRESVLAALCRALKVTTTYDSLFALDTERRWPCGRQPHPPIISRTLGEWEWPQPDPDQHGRRTCRLRPDPIRDGNRSVLSAVAESAVGARAAWMAHGDAPGFDVAGADDETWAVLSWVAGCLLHGRTMLARFALYDLLAARVAPVTGESLYEIDGELLARFEPTMPRSFDSVEISRALRATVVLYEQLLTEWAVSADTAVPSSAFRPAVLDVLDRLVAGGGNSLAPA